MKNFKATELSDLNRNCYAYQKDSGLWNFTAHYGDADVIKDDVDCLTLLKEATVFFEAIAGTEYLWSVSAHYGYKDVESGSVTCFQVFRDALDFFKDCQGGS